VEAKSRSAGERVPGVGETTAHALIAELPELGKANRQEIAKLRAGAAPLNCDSGKRRGQRTTWGGRASVRRALYMATLVATRYNDRIRTFYHRLLDRGKAKKKALVASMRKLLVILNTMVKNGTDWNPDLHTPSS
jgi:transposase